VAEYTDFDLILIAAGTNDIAPSGDFEDSFVAEDAPVPISTLNRTVFASAVRYAVETLQKLYPNAAVFVCTPPQAYVNTRTYLSTKTKRDYLITICERLSVQYIDTFMCGISAMWEVKSSNGRDLRDGLHPNANGAKKIAQYNAREIINYYTSVLDESIPNEIVNQIPISIDTDNTVFNGTGWIGGKRISSSGALKDSEYSGATGYIKVQAGDVIRFTDGGTRLNWSGGANASVVMYADSDFGCLGSFTQQPYGYGICTGANAFTISADTNGVYTFTVQDNPDIAYLRMSFAGKPADGSHVGDVILTVNEKIT
jgi:hypothetical protein